MNIWRTIKWMNDIAYKLKMAVKRFLDNSFKLMNEWMNKKTNEWVYLESIEVAHCW